MTELLLARQAAIMIAVVIAAYTDYKTGYIYDWITIPLVGFGLALNIIEQEFMGIAIGAATFAIGYALYYTGKLGGGDVKLFAGIAMALPFFAGGIFVVSAALLAALGAVVFLSTFYVVKYYKRGIELEYNKDGIRRALVISGMVAAYFYFLFANNFVSQEYVIGFGAPIVFGLLFIALEKGIRKEFFLQKISVHALEDDEIIALDFVDKNVAEKLGAGFKGVFGEKEKRLLAGAGVKEIMVYRNLPRFGPFILLGVILAFTLKDFWMLLAGGTL